MSKYTLTFVIFRRLTAAVTEAEPAHSPKLEQTFDEWMKENEDP